MIPSELQSLLQLLHAAGGADAGTQTSTSSGTAEELELLRWLELLESYELLEDLELLELLPVLEED